MPPRSPTLTTNATYIIESKNKQNGEPLSLVPDYTINAALDWYASVTHYGTTPSPSLAATTNIEIATQKDHLAYTLVNLVLSYEFAGGGRASAGRSQHI